MSRRTLSVGELIGYAFALVCAILAAIALVAIMLTPQADAAGRRHHRPRAMPSYCVELDAVMLGKLRTVEPWLCRVAPRGAPAPLLPLPVILR